MTSVESLLTALSLVVLADIATSVAVARSGLYGRSQVLAQIGIVWVVPILGAILVATFLWSQRRQAPRRSAGEDPDRWQGGEDHAGADHHVP